jgi:hypothetical protein
MTNVILVNDPDKAMKCFWVFPSGAPSLFGSGPLLFLPPFSPFPTSLTISEASNGKEKEENET